MTAQSKVHDNNSLADASAAEEADLTLIYQITYPENRRKKYEMLPADRTVGTKPGTEGGPSRKKFPPFCVWFLRNSSVCRQNLMFVASIFQVSN